MLQPKGSIAGATTIKSVTPDVRAPSRSWSLAFLGKAWATSLVQPAPRLGW
jgi:hypothetical protein